MLRRSFAALLVVVLAGSTACTGGSEDGIGTDASVAAPPSTTTAPRSFPTDTWGTADPVEAGFDPAGLDALAAEADAAGSGCLVVARDGELVLDESWGPGAPGDPREAFSVTKSITSVLTGIAEDEGELALDDPASDFIPAWQGTPADVVTVEDLLANDSGREWGLAIDYRQLIGAPDKTTFAVDLAQVDPPGEVWAYNNSAIQTLSAVLDDATGQQAADWAEQALFEPIGMADSSLSTDAAGGTVTFMGLQTTCQDLARFGHLLLHDGAWAGQQVVSADYVGRATGAPATDLAANYGLLFWLNRRGALVTPTIATTGSTAGGEADGQMVPGAPEDVFWALGFNQQVVAVLPSEGVVAVRMGPAPPAEAPFGYAELTNGVLEALR